MQVLMLQVSKVFMYTLFVYTLLMFVLHACPTECSRALSEEMLH